MKAIKSEGYVTVKDYNSYARFNVFKGKYYRIKMILLGLLLFVVCAAMVVVGFLIGSKKLWILAGAILLGVLFFFYMLGVSVKNTCKLNADTVRALQKTMFGKNGFVVDLVFKDESKNERYEILYDEIEQLYLTRDAMYIYVEKRSAIVIPKRNLKIEPADALAFLKEYAPHKLVVCA